jgi:hypothetical protein
LTWRAKRSAGALLGLLFLGLAVVVDGWLLNLLLNGHVRPQQINLLSFVIGLILLCSLPFMLLLAYQAASCLTLRYHLDRNGVVVRWAGIERTIPIRSIQRIVPGDHLGGSIVHRRGIRWPGHERGEGLVPGLGRTLFLATRPLAEQLLLVTPGQTFAISPGDADGFVRAFEARREMGPNRLLTPEVRHAQWLTWRIWTDQTTWLLLGAALAVNLGLFFYLCLRFPTLDLQLPLHFNRLGQVDRIGTKMELFALPIIGLIVLGTNLVLGLALYKRERAGSYLLWGGAAAVEALFWLAAFSIVP